MTTLTAAWICAFSIDRKGRLAQEISVLTHSGGATLPGREREERVVRASGGVPRDRERGRYPLKHGPSVPPRTLDRKGEHPNKSSGTRSNPPRYRTDKPCAQWKGSLDRQGVPHIPQEDSYPENLT